MIYLLDTNTVINFLDGSIPQNGMDFLKSVLKNESILSVITEMEVLGYNFENSEDENITKVFIEASTVIQIDKNVVAETINIRKSKKIKLPDAIIAATALVHKLKIVSRNVSDFDGIKNIEVINPFAI